MNTARYCQGIILVFDFTRKNTLENLDYWLELIKENCFPSPNIVLFVNKKDINIENWEVTLEEVKSYAETRNLVYFETSAKTGQGIKEGFSYLANEIYDRLENINISDNNNNNITIRRNNRREDITRCIGKNRKSKNKK